MDMVGEMVGTCYSIELEDKVGLYYQYTRKENVLKLARFLNELIADSPKVRIVSVSVYADHIVGDKLLTDWEYKNQFFFETYEDRLIMAGYEKRKEHKYPLVTV